MKGQDCKYPISEECPNFFNKEKSGPPSKHKKFLILAWFLVLVMISITIGFTFRSLNEINDLKQEIGYLKVSVEKLKVSVDYLNKKVTDLEENKFSTERHIFLTDKKQYYDDLYDISYDDDSEDLYDDDDDLDNDLYPEKIEELLTGQDFTKDAKTTLPPRPKRSIIGYTQDEVPDNSDPYQDQRRKNMTQKHNTVTTARSDSYPLYSKVRVQNLENHLTTPTPKHSKIRDSKQETHQAVKTSPSLKSGDSYYSRENPNVDFTIVSDDQIGLGRTRHRQRRLELDDRSVRYGRMRPLPAAHFNGDTSKYVLGQHEDFAGNGKLKHKQTFVDWAESSWFQTLEMDRYFSYSDGFLTVAEPGLYFIYAQIFYIDAHDVNGFKVYRNETETLLQCTTMTHTLTMVIKSNTCYTAAAHYLQENDRISLGDISEGRYSLFEPGKSFFGVIKIGDVKIPRRK